MEIFALVGNAAKELFDYNRENYQFDADQQLTRELLRLDMQIKRLELFREDIRDLVELTVGKMEMYHLVGALFLEKTVALYCEGRIKEQMPPFMLALYYLSVAGSFAFLVLAVWLSMYASISSHSFGVRLLTRYVRLPIPGAGQLNSLNARLTDFESQGKQMLRVPFIGKKQQWLFRQEQPQPPSAEGGGQQGHSEPRGVVPPMPAHGPLEDHLGRGEVPLGAEERLMEATSQLPGKHVQLYRRLQITWQCYDAYARVSMALGANQILLAFTFYLIDVTLIQFKAPSATYACIFAFQFAALCLCYIDICKLGVLPILGMQALPTAACFIASIEAHHVAYQATEGQDFDPDYVYRFSPLCFFLIAFWFEMLLRTSWPSNDDASLPRKFRAVLFLDVFEDAEVDISKWENQLPGMLFDGEGGRQRSSKPPFTRKQARDTYEALFSAHAALRRWEAVTAGMSAEQMQEVARLRNEVKLWQAAFNGEAADRARRRGIQDVPVPFEIDDRPWQELSEQEQQEDPHSGSLVGPFRCSDGRGISTFYFNVESGDTGSFVYQIQEGTTVLELSRVSELVAFGEEQVRALLGSDGAVAGQMSAGSSTSMDSDAVSSEESDASRPRAASSFSIRGGFNVLHAATTGRRSNATKRDAAPNIPPRMPWRILRLIIRALQVAWIVMGVDYLLEVLGILRFDYQIYTEVEERRLQGTRGIWGFEEVEAAFPQGDWFRPKVMSCLPGANESDVTRILVGTPQDLYSATTFAVAVDAGRNDRPGPSRVEFELLPEHVFPRGAVAVCGPPPEGCLMATLEENGSAVAVWQHGAPRSGATVLPLESSRPWKLLAGAVMRCVALRGMDLNAGEAGAAAGAGWCLLLAGWDGTRLPVAVVALPGDPATPPRSGRVLPTFDVPLRLPQSARNANGEVRKEAEAAEAARLFRLKFVERQPPVRPLANASKVCPQPKSIVGLQPPVLALHVDMLSGRLWALLATGALQAWNLAPPRSLGRWHPWPSSRQSTFKPTAFCSTPGGQLHALGHSSRTGPRWYRTWVPADLDGLGGASRPG